MNRRLPSNVLRRVKQWKSYTFTAIFVSIFLLSIIAFVTFDILRASGRNHNPARLIQAMSESIQTLSYEGTFVILSGSAVDTIKTKQINDGAETVELLKSLNGEAREVFRNSERVMCIWPNSRSVFTMKSQDRLTAAEYGGTLKTNYRYKQLPHDRIAGRETFVVDIVANDTDRYSYRVWIDQETKMLLKSVSLDHRNYPIEQMMFTDIRFGRDITIENVSKKLKSLKYHTETYAEPSSVSNAIEPNVSFDVLPRGFRKVSEMNHPMPNITGTVRHIFLTDGMASISIYVQFDHDSADETNLGLSKLGAMAAYGRKTDTAFTTVIGDVPAHTIRAVAQAVRVNEP